MKNIVKLIAVFFVFGSCATLSGSDVPVVELSNLWKQQAEKIIEHFHEILKSRTDRYENLTLIPTEVNLRLEQTEANLITVGVEFRIKEQEKEEARDTTWVDGPLKGQPVPEKKGREISISMDLKKKAYVVTENDYFILDLEAIKIENPDFELEDHNEVRFEIPIESNKQE